MRRRVMVAQFGRHGGTGSVKRSRSSCNMASGGNWFPPRVLAALVVASACALGVAARTSSAGASTPKMTIALAAPDQRRSRPGRAGGTRSNARASNAAANNRCSNTSSALAHGASSQSVMVCDFSTGPLQLNWWLRHCQRGRPGPVCTTALGSISSTLIFDAGVPDIVEYNVVSSLRLTDVAFPLENISAAGACCTLSASGAGASTGAAAGAGISRRAADSSIDGGG